MNLHSYLLVRAKPQYKMPHRQRNVPSLRKYLILPYQPLLLLRTMGDLRVLHFSWWRAKNFEALHQQLRTQKLKAFLEISGKIYPNLVNVLYDNLKFSDDVLKYSVKGMEGRNNMEGCGWFKT